MIDAMILPPAGASDPDGLSRRADTAPAGEFRTFIHISDYGEVGYHHLHRLIASSRPLVLWAPSGHMIEKHSQVGVDEFLGLVNDGHIRVVGRRDWIYNVEGYREGVAKRWPDGAWHDRIDSFLSIVAANEETLDGKRSRVYTVEQEDGPQVAAQLLGMHDGKATNDDLFERVLALYDAEILPTGSIERAHNARQRALKEHVDRGEDQSQADHVANLAVVHMVLRDARNHAKAAKALSKADIPFLTPEDEEFFELLDQPMRMADLESLEPGVEDDRQTRKRLTQFWRSSLDFLETLESSLADIHRHGDEESTWAPRLDQFVGTTEHADFTNWLREYARDIDGPMTDQTISQLLMRELRRDVAAAHKRAYPQSKGKLAQQILSIPNAGNLGGKILTVAAVIGLLLRLQAIQQLFAGDMNVLKLIGTGSFLTQVGTRTVQQIGWMDTDYGGDAWPYMYAFGRPPTKADIASLRQAIDRVRQESGDRFPRTFAPGA